MPKAPNMYQCSRCGGYMTFKERFKKKVIVSGPGMKVQYWEDLDPQCAQADIEGKDLKQLGSVVGGGDDGNKVPKQAVTGGDEHRSTAKSSTASRRGQSPADGNGVPTRKSRSATSKVS
jgi:hypothetical protein